MKMEKLFDKVVMVNMSIDPDLKKIQSDIANQLDLYFGEDEPFSSRSVRLLESLDQSVKTLIVLDNQWEKLELAEVGIPYKIKGKGCKVVLTTSDQNLCAEMETDVKIELPSLSESDAWTLLGEVVGLSTDQTIYDYIVDKCRGLPLAIVTMRRALRDEDQAVWRVALTQVNSLTSSLEGTKDAVFASIYMRYQCLGNNAIKLCFLFCSLFPKIKFDVLLSYAVGENLLTDADTMEGARVRLQTIVKVLTSEYLLLIDGDGYIRMHYVIHDAAIAIASEEGAEFVVIDGMKREWPDMELDKCMRLSLMGNEIRCNLPYQISAPNLLTLSLNNCKYLDEIPPDFFKEMRNLLTLDLSSTDIKSLPASLSCLANLRTLCLENCMSFSFKTASPIKKLGRLEILNLCHSGIESLPEEIGMLTRLKLLNLSHTFCLKSISRKMLSNLYQLEELYVINDESIVWETEGMGEGRNDSCTRLTSLDLHVCLSRFFPIIHWESLINYKVVVSGRLDSLVLESFLKNSKNFKRSIFLELPSASVGDPIIVLLKRTNILYLYKCKGLKSVLQIDPRDRLNDDLISLYVRECDEMKHLMTTKMEKAPISVCSNLECVSLEMLTNFETICDGTLPRGFLNKLRVLKVLKCDKVITLIPHDLLVRLQNLEKLYIEDCQGLERLAEFVEDNEAEEKQVFVPLAHTSLGTTSSTNSKQSSKSKLYCLQPSSMFPCLQKLDIINCDALSYLFPVKAVQGLLQLKEMNVKHCSNVEKIFAHDSVDEDCDSDEDRGNLPQLILHQLMCLRLNTLPKLVSFGPPDFSFECPYLVELAVEGCKNLKRLPVSVRYARKLKKVIIDDDWFDALEWDDASIKHRLQTLKLETSSYQLEEDDDS